MNASNKNILVVFDAAGCAPVSLHVVAELAAGLRANIKALYVEDANLINAVDLPFTREISLHTAEISNIDSTKMKQKFRVAAEDIRKQIEEIAVTRSISMTFSSTRGYKTQVVRERTDEVTMVMIPAVYSSNGRKRLQQLKTKVVMLYGGIDQMSDKSLDIAVSQASNKKHQLIVIVDSLKSKRHVEKRLNENDGRIECEVADLSNFDEVVSLVYKYSPGLLVLPENSQLVGDESMLQYLIDMLEADILLVR
jgi:hypothetical protein